MNAVAVSWTNLSCRYFKELKLEFMQKTLFSHLHTRWIFPSSVIQKISSNEDVKVQVFTSEIFPASCAISKCLMNTFLSTQLIIYY